MTLDIQSGILRPKIDMHCHVWLMDGWERSADHLVDSGAVGELIALIHAGGDWVEE